MKRFSFIFSFLLILSTTVASSSQASCCSSISTQSDKSFVEAVVDKYDCALVTFKIKRPHSRQEWQKIIELLQNILHQYKQRGQNAVPTKVLKDLEAVLEEIFALEDIHGEISFEYVLEKCPCKNKAQCSENCECGALECKGMQVTKGAC